MPDHVQMLMLVPPKYAVARLIGYIEGKSAIHIALVYAGRMRNLVGHHFRARGYRVSMVGRDEASVRRCIQEKQKEDKRLEQLQLMAP